MDEREQHLLELLLACERAVARDRLPRVATISLEEHGRLAGELVRRGWLRRPLAFSGPEMKLARGEMLTVTPAGSRALDEALAAQGNDYEREPNLGVEDRVRRRSLMLAAIYQLTDGRMSVAVNRALAAADAGFSEDAAKATVGQLVESGQLRYQDFAGSVSLTADGVRAAEATLTSRELPDTQARQVRAWCDLFHDPPIVQVVNNSYGPIRDVVPALLVESMTSGALLGGNDLEALGELPPFEGFAWRLDHMRAVAADPSARSSLNVSFSDAAGRRWRIGHDQLEEVLLLKPGSLKYVTLGEPPRPVANVELPREVQADASAQAQKVAFVSYVHEDNDLVDRLCGDLRREGVLVWRDRDELFPGDQWKQQVRDAITRGSFSFIACFSAESVAKEVTYMNEELALAVEELRRRKTTNWFLPVILTECKPPDPEIGIHGHLSDIQQCSLVDDWTHGFSKLLVSIRRLA